MSNEYIFEEQKFKSASLDLHCEMMAYLQLIFMHSLVEKYGEEKAVEVYDSIQRKVEPLKSKIADSLYERFGKTPHIK